MNYMVQQAVDALSQGKGDDMTARSSTAAGSRLLQNRRPKGCPGQRKGAVSSEGHYRTASLMGSQIEATDKTDKLSFATLSHAVGPPDLERTFHTLAPDAPPLRSQQDIGRHLRTKPKAPNPMSILNKTQDRVYPVNMHFVNKPSQIKLSMEFYNERRGLNTQGGSRR